MGSPSTSVTSLRHRLSIAGRTALLVVLGVVFDTCGIVNVPGAYDLVGDKVTVSELGIGLVLLVIAAWITVRWRRTRPLVPLFAGAVLAVIGISYVLLLIGAVAAVRRYPGRAGLIGGLTAAVVGLFALREAITDWGAALSWFMTAQIDAQYEAVWIAASFIWALISLALAAGVVLYSRMRGRADQSEVRAEREHQRADEATEQVVRQAERERIARDMHDALAHRLSVVSLHAGALEAAAGAGAGVDAGAGDIARTVREQTHAALQDMRGLIGDLRRGDEAPAASPASMRAIGALLAELRVGGAPVLPHVIIESPERAGALLDSAVFRIVQESLTNALKHAPGSRIDVFVQVGPQDGARIRVVNPLGIGSGVAPLGGGNGTLGIRERADALGGTAWIGAHEGCFIVDVTLPWHESG